VHGNNDESVVRVMNLILLGAPGSGKGTHAEFISESLGIPQISTGNILREAVKNGTESGLKAKSIMEAGGLVPDEIVIGVLKDRIAGADCKDGYILDGFPRNVAQAKALEEMGITIDRVINIEVPDEKIRQRLSGRRVCEGCGASYHVEYKPTKKDGVCDKCGGAAVLRKDDAPETVIERLKTYHELTSPLIEFYENKGKLHKVTGQEDVGDTKKLVLDAINA